MYSKPNYQYKNKSQALKKAKQRLYKRVYNLIQNYNCLFLTFTFSNKTLSKTNQETRKRYIKRFLNQYAERYILNIDYGEQNQREHYHALMIPKYKIVLFDDYLKYGYINGFKIAELRQYKNKSTEQKADLYTNHAIKSTTKDNKLIYSRDSKPINRKLKKQIDLYLIELERKKLEKQNNEYKEFLAFINDEIEELDKYRIKEQENEIDIYIDDLKSATA